MPAQSNWSDEVHSVLREQNVRQVAYVPDTGLKRLIELVRADKKMRAVPLTTEEEGVALATGAWLGGEKSALMLQSSGVGNCINMLGMVIECRIPLLMIGAACVGMAVTLTRRDNRERAAKKRTEAVKRAEPRVEDYLAIDPMEVELGIGLIRAADPQRGGDLLDRIARVRQSLAAEIGVILPKVRIRDNMRLEQNQYRIKISDMVVAEGIIYPNMFLAMDSRMTTGTLPVTTKEG